MMKKSDPVNARSQTSVTDLSSSLYKIILTEKVYKNAILRVNITQKYC
jgi:hypothetical protein